MKQKTSDMKNLNLTLHKTIGIMATVMGMQHPVLCGCLVTTSLCTFSPVTWLVY
jgi:hypothetical protein